MIGHENIFDTTRRLNELLGGSASRHRHLCPRQVLGVRMGMMAGRLLDLDLPQKNKRLFVFMETDGCAADGVSVASGAWVGRRTMRVMDYGKVAATFVDTRTGQSLRIHPHPKARLKAASYRPQARSRWNAQLEAYQIMPDEELLKVQEVVLTVDLKAIISRPSTRAVCEQCGEEIINQRQVQVEGSTLCQSCAGSSYYRCRVPFPAQVRTSLTISHN